jgi:hypothetical protein
MSGMDGQMVEIGHGGNRPLPGVEA